MRRLSVVGSTLLAWLLIAVVALVTATPASADVPAGCWEEDRSDELGNITVVVICPPGVGNNPGDGAGEGSGGGGGDGETRECTYRALTIACETDDGIWNGTCYVKVADPQPAADHPVWGGREPGDGVIIQCSAYDAGDSPQCDADGGCGASRSLQWAAAAPGAGPSPAALARQALASMQLSMGEIGSTPPEGTTASLVGLPIWLWVSNPAPNTTGPITATASDGGVSITVTATLDRIEYSMVRQSDGTTTSITCAGDAAGGTAYDASYGDAPSPTCGITADQNQRTGTYTITGTAYWTAEWSGAGQNGTIPVELDNSIQLEVDQLQVIQVG